MDKKRGSTVFLPSLKDSLFLGFCAAFIIITRIALRLHLKIPGHSMFFTLFFLFIARGCVPWRFSATFAGFLSGIIAVILGLGKGGPLVLLKFLMPGMVVDICAFVMPMLFESYFLCALTGLLAAATKFIDTLIKDYIIGMDRSIIVKHALIDASGAIFFGVAAGLFVPPVIKKLKAFDVI